LTYLYFGVDGSSVSLPSLIFTQKHKPVFYLFVVKNTGLCLLFEVLAYYANYSIFMQVSSRKGGGLYIGVRPKIF